MSELQPKDHEIRETLTRLHDELERTHTLDEDERAMMRHLMNDIQAALRQGESATAPDANPVGQLVDRLNTAINVLEVSHPTLTSTLKKVLDTLTIAGI